MLGRWIHLINYCHCLIWTVFYSLDLDLLLQHLVTFGLSGTVLNGFRFYLIDRTLFEAVVGIGCFFEVLRSRLCSWALLIPRVHLKTVPLITTCAFYLLHLNWNVCHLLLFVKNFSAVNHFLSQTVRNLLVIDTALSLESQISAICKPIFYEVDNDSALSFWEKKFKTTRTQLQCQSHLNSMLSMPSHTYKFYTP